MPKFILNVFAPLCDPERARVLIASRFPTCREEVEDSHWSKTEIEIGKWLGKKRLTVSHDPANYTGEKWKQQKAGMQNYFLQGKASPRRNAMQAVIDRFQFNIAFVLDPAPDQSESIDSDPRAALVFDLAKELGGVVFVPGVLLDPSGLPLIMVDGAFDPDARCENLDESAVQEIAAAPGFPTVGRVAKRCLALASISCRGVLERDVQKLENPAENHHRLLDWINELGIEEEFEDGELDILNTPPGELSRQDAVNSLWRVEGLEVLAWALKLHALPRYDALSDVDGVWKVTGVLNGPAAQAVLQNAVLRAPEELEQLQNRMFALHWRIRQFGLKPEKMDFRKFAAEAKFGPLDISGLELIDDELTIRGKRIDQLDSEVLSELQSIVNERHLAANWLVEGGVYSATDTPT